ncbi:MAG TPA: hypothetical protein VMM56_01775 [Planctomycetaceae bacterium]|nr:hypothetical protein [Planctomycetaceae bacterium]
MRNGFGESAEVASRTGETCLDGVARGDQRRFDEVPRARWGRSADEDD